MVFFNQRVPACDTYDNAYKSLFKTGQAPGGETNSSEAKRTLIDLSQQGHVHDLGVCLTTVFLQPITNMSVSLY